MNQSIDFSDNSRPTECKFVFHLLLFFQTREKYTRDNLLEITIE